MTACQLVTWAENAVKFKLKLSKKWKIKPGKNEVESGKQTVESFIPIFHDFAVSSCL